MKNMAYIKLSAVRLTAGLLMVLLLSVSTVRLFHYHEANLIESSLESEQHSSPESCVICDYILQKHSGIFSSAAVIELKVFAILAYIYHLEVLRKEIKAFRVLSSNKAPPELS
jgi:hypothetical protein